MLLLILSRMAIALSSAVAVKLYTSLLSVAEVGTLAYFLTLCQFCSMMGVYPAGSYYQRHLLKWASLHRLGGKSAGYLLQLAVGACLSVLLVETLHRAGPVSLDWTLVELVVAIVIFQIGPPLRETMLSALNMLGRPVAYAWLGFVSAYAAIATGWIALAYRPSALVWLLATSAIYLVFAGIAYGLVVTTPPPARLNADVPPDINFLKFGAPLVVVALGSWMLTDSGRIIVEEMGGKEALAVVSVALNLGAALVIIAEKIFSDLFSPALYRAASIGPAMVIRIWPRYLLRLGVVAGIVVIGIAITAPLITTILAGKNFHDIKYWIVAGALGRTGIAIVTSGFVVSQLLDQPHLLVPHSFIGAAIGAVLMVLFYRMAGVPGALLAFNVGIWITVATSIRTLKRRFTELAFPSDHPRGCVSLLFAIFIGGGCVICFQRMNLYLSVAAAVVVVISAVVFGTGVVRDARRFWQWLAEIREDRV